MEEGGGENQVKREGGGGEAMSIKVKDQNGGEVVFRVKPHTKFEKILNAFCSKKSVDVNQVRFVFEGERVNPTSTPSDLGMEDGGECRR
jgi:small ubiquitin-related modifier